MDAIQDLLDKLGRLNVCLSGDRRAPHKPLLLLLALSRVQRGLEPGFEFNDAEQALLPLLRDYAPPVQHRHQPELPYWHLRSDNLWEVEGAEAMPRQMGGFPKMGALRRSRASMPRWALDLLHADPALVAQAAQLLLDKHFPETLHESIARDVGLALDLPEAPVTSGLRPRDATFAREVLRAYEHRCAVTGFRAALDGAYFGVEAAHVRAHCWNGPDVVTNGLVLTPTMHKLFDHGAWSLTDDRRVLVSKRFTGSDEAIEALRRQHGRRLRGPLPGSGSVDPRFIRWHRESSLGGVFRQPALPL